MTGSLDPVAPGIVVLVGGDPGDPGDVAAFAAQQAVRTTSMQGE